MGLMRRKFQLRIISSSALSSEEFHDSLDESGQLGRKSERIGRSSRCSTWITFSFHRLVSNLKSPLPFRASNLASNSIFHRFESSSCCYCHTVCVLANSPLIPSSSTQPLRFLVAIEISNADPYNRRFNPFDYRIRIRKRRNFWNRKAREKVAPSRAREGGSSCRGGSVIGAVSYRRVPSNTLISEIGSLTSLDGYCLREGG